MAAEAFTAVAAVLAAEPVDLAAAAVFTAVAVDLVAAVEVAFGGYGGGDRGGGTADSAAADLAAVRRIRRRWRWPRWFGWRTDLAAMAVHSVASGLGAGGLGAGGWRLGRDGIWRRRTRWSRWCAAGSAATVQRPAAVNSTASSACRPTKACTT